MSKPFSKYKSEGKSAFASYINIFCEVSDLKLSELIYENEYSSKCPANVIEITEIVTDTSKITKNCLFICIAGRKYNPHKMLDYIAKKGAAAIITQVGEEYERTISAPIFEVNNSREILSLAYARFYKNPQKRLRMIGITGTNGKTSTSYILRSILRRAGYKVGLIGTVECLIENEVYSLPDNTQNADKLKTMTTPDAEILYKILDKMVSAGIEYVIMEVSSHSLALKKVSPIFFDIAIFTNLAPEHLDFHITMENYMLSKAELFRRCKYGIFNCDSEYAQEIINKSSCEVIRCSVSGREKYRAEDVKLLGSRGVEYIYSSPDLQMKIKSGIPAVFTVYNSLFAIIAALKLGVPYQTIIDALYYIPSVSGRLERLNLGDEDNEFSVFIDFAHTESALKNILNTVRSFRSGGERIVLLFGCGGNRDRTKRAPMGRVAEELSDFVIVTSDNSRNEDKKQIIRDILEGMNDVNKRRVILDRKKAIEYAILNAKKNDIIILAGKGHEMYQIDSEGEYFFDERKIVSCALEKRRNGDNNK